MKRLKMTGLMGVGWGRSKRGWEQKYIVKYIGKHQRKYLYQCALKGQGKINSLDGCMLNVREKRHHLYCFHSSGNQKEDEKVLHSAWALWGEVVYSYKQLDELEL